MIDSWPELDYLSWRETCAALHLYTQIVGKYRLAREAGVNHSWHATFCGIWDGSEPRFRSCGINAASG